MTKYQLTEKLKNQEINLKKDEDLVYVVMLSENMEKCEKLKFNLEGDNSSVKCIVINIGRDSNSFDFEIIPNHIGKHTSSEILVKSALFDKSKTSFIGTIEIDKNASNTSSYLTHNTLLLSDKSSVRTDPRLEIENDDVKAGHAATVGKVSEDMLFYLKSRGIDESTGLMLIVEGFLESAADEIEDLETKELVLGKIKESFLK